MSMEDLTDGLSTKSSDKEFHAYLWEFAKNIFKDDLQGMVLKGEVQDKLFEYITKHCVCPRTDSRALISRVYSSDPWADCPDFPQEDWRAEVVAKDTILGYREWLQHKIEEKSHDQSNG